MEYVLMAIVALLIVLLLAWFLLKKKYKNQTPISPLGNISIILVIFGIIGANALSNNKFVGYSLIGAGVVLAIIDIFIKSKNKLK